MIWRSSIFVIGMHDSSQVIQIDVAVTPVKRILLSQARWKTRQSAVYDIEKVFLWAKVVRKYATTVEIEKVFLLATVVRKIAIAVDIEKVFLWANVVRKYAITVDYLVSKRSACLVEIKFCNTKGCEWMNEWWYARIRIKIHVSFFLTKQMIFSSLCF